MRDVVCVSGMGYVWKSKASFWELFLSFPSGIWDNKHVYLWNEPSLRCCFETGSHFVTWVGLELRM